VRNWLILLAAATFAAWLALANRRADGPATATSARAPGAVEPSSPAALARAGAIRAREGFVGSQACAPCHQAQSEAYLASHHAKALVVPGTELEGTHFDQQQLTSKLGGQTRFSLQDGTPVVTTSIAGGKVATLPISYVSGVPNDASSLQALASYLGEAGESERSKEVLRKWDALLRE
jgi:hypothetical protein